MKNLRFNTGFFDSNIFKNSVITFGMCLSFITITSFDNISGKDQSSESVMYIEQTPGSDCEQISSDEYLRSSTQEHNQKTHHNFIASYLLKESSAKKETKKTGSESNIFGQLLQIHKTIITAVVNLL